MKSILASKMGLIDKKPHLIEPAIKFIDLVRTNVLEDI